MELVGRIPYVERFQRLAASAGLFSSVFPPSEFPSQDGGRRPCHERFAFLPSANDSRTALRFVEPGRYMLQHLALSERPSWRPSGLAFPRQVLAHTPVTHLLAKGTVWQLWPETRNPKALKAGFLATVWGLWTCFLSGCPRFSSHPWSTSQHCPCYRSEGGKEQI